MKLNYGCGETKLKGYINIDAEKKVKPDLVHDITKKVLPYAANTISEVVCSHNIEHIEEKWWPFVFNEFLRVLKYNGRLILSYPEFDVCVKYYQENKRGLREFWKQTLYGRQLWPGDFHITPVNSWEIELLLKRVGFTDIKSGPEPKREYYSCLVAYKRQDSLRLEDLYNQDIFNVHIHANKGRRSSKHK